MTKTNHLRAIISVCVSVMTLSACTTASTGGSSSSTTAIVPPPTPTSTPFMPATEAPDPGEVSLWVDPALPSALCDPVVELVDGSAGRYVFVEQAEDAQLRVEMQPERPLTHWVYAVVAPFPTVRDDLALEELQRRWDGSSETGGLIVTGQSAALLRKGFGVSPGETVLQVEAEHLLEDAWAAGDYFSVIPFEDLEPRWKVLRLEGQSPITKSFDPQGYPLLLPFGLSGPQSLVDELAGKLEW
ncbi:MAG: hypothetical protein PVF85_11325, partial [Anaerolineales bacterium]